MTDFEIAQKRSARRMAAIDALPDDIRALVHEYSYTVVDAFLVLGIKKPRHIRHLVEVVLNEFSPTRGSSSRQGTARSLTEKMAP